MSNTNLDIQDEFASDEELREELKKIVLARIQVMPDTLNVAVGSTKLSRSELVEHVEEEDEIGKQIIEIELEFLRDLASGAIYKNE